MHWTQLGSHQMEADPLGLLLRCSFAAGQLYK